MRAFFSARQLWIGVFLVCGGALALIAIFLPWHHYEPPAAGLPQDPRTFSPALWHLSTGQPDLVGVAIYNVPACVVALYAVVQAAFAGSILIRRIAGIVALLAAIAGLGITLMTMLFGNILNDSVYRYVVDAGGDVALLGYGLAFLGAMMALIAHG